jgi:CheY-like chemotaxis protein
MSDFTNAASDDPGPVVLVVDDTDAVREVVRAMLSRHGFAAVAAADGRDALDVYHELVQRGHDVSVLLDVQMPGLDGPLVLAALQALDPGVRACFMTGDPGQYGEDELLAMGARRVFRKPLDIASVAAEFRGVARAAGRAGRGLVPAG